MFNDPIKVAMSALETAQMTEDPNEARAHAAIATAAATIAIAQLLNELTDQADSGKLYLCIFNIDPLLA